jgi:hypothetical protein
MLKTLVFLTPFCIYLLVVFGTLIIARHRRKTRWPFKEEDRLIRGPGESLRREVSKIDESLFGELAGGLLAMLISTWASVSINTHLGGSPRVALFAGAMACLFSTLLSTRRILALWHKRQGYFLGWFGERIVAEKLAPLRFSGWRVFHDVPFISNGKPFNMDHIVVGEGGVFVIETKTRRKGGSSNAGRDDVVYFDGQALHWPKNKNDESGLRQAELNAQTLTKWIYDEIGERIPASPILAIPGWSLEFTGTKTRRQCKVDSPNWILNTFKDQTPCIPQKTVELIHRRLLAKCRDVED